ncbi:GIY-YIG nuclease family protein [Candidatus Nomurabacteria bacterium]|nr:GIY-YIG nuclease family protein [Candidatus Nomurabacteria bacterium]
MYYVYIISCADNTLYTGITTDIVRRLKEHNNTKLGAKYTKGRGPFTLVYSRRFRNRSNASKEEIRIKRLNRKDKLILIESKKS